jgi:predicted PurR-regulated permease PerM
MYGRLLLLVASAVVLYFSFRIFQPFLLSISLAAILASLTYPIFEWSSKKLNGKSSLAALLTVFWVTVSLIVPFVLLIFLAAGEVTNVYGQVQEKLQTGELEKFVAMLSDSQLRFLFEWTEPYVNVKEINLAASLTATLQQISLILLRYSTSLLSGFFQTIMHFLIMLVILFFLFRDGESLRERIHTLIPISPTYEQQIVEKFRVVATATVLGNLLTAVAQGVAGGLVYWALGIPNPLFWSFATALFSMVPVAGTAIIWVPWAIYFLLTDLLFEGVILIFLSLFVVGMIDNLIRPLFIEGRAKMNTLMVFLSIMGGISYFGVLGMIFGPIIVAVGITFLELYKLEFQSDLSESGE